MKRVRVYQQIRSEENLRLAIQEVCASHRRNGDHSLNKKVLEIEANLDDYVKKLDKFIQDLVSGDAHMNKPIKRRRWDRNRVISFKRASGLISRLGQLRKCNSQKILERYYQPKTMFDLKKVVRRECRRLQALYPPYVAA